MFYAHNMHCIPFFFLSLLDQWVKPACLIADEENEGCTTPMGKNGSA